MSDQSKESQTEQENPSLEFPSREELEKQLTAVESKLTKIQEQALRAQAEYENARKRAEREVEKAYKFGSEQLLNDLLPVLDSFAHGLEGSASTDPKVRSICQGMQLTLSMFEKTLEKHGVEIIAPKKGENFNPQSHEAISMQEDAEAKSNTIMEVLQKGYQLNGRVLRPARVIVVR
jgi:molecular chaperone GrpE